MVRSMGRSNARLAATLGLALSTAACGTVLRTGMGLLGLDRTDAARNSAADPLAAAGARRAPGMTRTYEWAPVGWERWAVGEPYSPARYLSSTPGPRDSCISVSAGLTRVLPVSTAAGNPVYGLGPIGVGVAGEGYAPFHEAMALNQLGLAGAAMRRVAEMGTHCEGCSTSIFGYVRLGLWGSSTAIVVR